MANDIGLWIGFTAFVVIVLSLDLGIFHRHARETSLREAALWTGAWVSLALAFNIVVYVTRGPVPALEFLTGYIIEWSLSMDNVFVFAVLFTYFGVPNRYQHRVLFWGIMGAVIMRLTFILIGAALLRRFSWVIYVFGVIVLLAGVKMFRGGVGEYEPEHNPVLKLGRKYLRLTAGFVGNKFFVREDGVRKATPLFLVLLVVETTDVVFAVDSIPAIFAITRDPFIVFTSNIFAILGLRALYFLLAGVMDTFRYLDQGLAIILCFIGVKMLVSELYHIPIGISLGIVCAVLAGSILLSLYADRANRRAGPAAPAEQKTALDE